MNSAVTGLGFGDEGKGLTTSFLSSFTKRPLVVRFNGGHQAGHTVVHEGKRHVFSSFGSGTLQGVPTYWSQFCTFYPTGFINELKELGSTPFFYIHPLCPVTTPYDVRNNREEAYWGNNGTVGVGFGATLKRQESFYKLFVQDLYHPQVLIQKLKAIASYYGYEFNVADVSNFLAHVTECTGLIQMNSGGLLEAHNCIYEGAQGILLDMDFGFFPNVTRSNTTTKNAHTLGKIDNVYYVTRSYLTRHGNGYFPPEQELNLRNAENETNVDGGPQGVFRKTALSPELLNYALSCDENFSKRVSKNLVITCMDQYEIDVDELLGKLNTRFNQVWLSYGPSTADMRKHKSDVLEYA